MFVLTGSRQKQLYLLAVIHRDFFSPATFVGSFFLVVKKRIRWEEVRLSLFFCALAWACTQLFFFCVIYVWKIILLPGIDSQIHILSRVLPFFLFIYPETRFELA